MNVDAVSPLDVEMIDRNAASAERCKDALVDPGLHLFAEFTGRASHIQKRRHSFGF